jgi:Xaa-Pro aminopeptidase
VQAPELDPPRRGELVRDRLEQVRRLLDERSAGGLLLDSRRDFAWLTLGGLNHVVLASEKGAAPILVTRDDAVVLAPTNERARIADEEVAGLPIEVESLPWWESDAAVRSAEARAGGEGLLRAEEVAAELEAARTALVPEEHARMEWLAGEISGAIAGVGVPGTSDTEDDLVAAITEPLTRSGLRLPVVLAAADERIDRYRHPLPTATRIRRRLMLVLVVERWGLHVAHTEFFEREERSPDLVARARALDDVLYAMREATTVGQTLGDVLAASRAAYDRHGMHDEWTLHHQGGTIGYAGRERIAVPGDATPIRPGMAFAWNPSITGLKLEETLYLDGEGRQQILTGPAAQN